MTARPLCFVLMPFGEKHDPSGGPPIDFDRIYHSALAPAIEEAGMEPIRADEERTGGIIHTPMFERLLLCDYAIADLTTANANVFYELGVRHTARPSTTLTIFARQQPIPFDVNFLRSLPYDLGEGNTFGEEESAAVRQAVAERLAQLRDVAAETEAVDSPLFQLLGAWVPGDIARIKTDLFRDRVQLNEELKRRLAAVRRNGSDSAKRDEAVTQLTEIRSDLEPLVDTEAGTLVDLLLTHRALSDWNGMIELEAELPEALRRQVLVREQVAFAHNRRAGATGDEADRDEALRILQGVEDQQGPSSETAGLMGRVYKDRWQGAVEAGDEIMAESHLERSVAAYRRGFLADPRDTYPGVNLVTLLDIQGSAESLAEKERVLPVVRFGAERRLAGPEPDYWDHATMLEIEALDDQEEAASAHHRRAVSTLRETWEAGTTSRNLRLILDARSARGVEQPWLERIAADLEGRAG